MKAILAIVIAMILTGIAGPAHAASLGRYCSVSYAGGGWAFESATNLTFDPCADIQKKSGAGTIARAGLYSVSAVNNVVARCNTQSTYVLIFQGVGNGPLTAAFNRAVKDKQRYCVFTVAARELAIFNAPFSLATSYTHVTGVDFARSPYNTLDLLHDFGRVGGSTHATKVDWMARDESSTSFINDHDGHDILINTGTVLHAVAAGSVLAARFRDVQIACGRSDKQGEVWIQHRVSGITGAVTTTATPSPYDELFVTFYAHLSKIQVSQRQVVAQNAVLGLSGSTGCSSAPHVHFGTFKVSNTASFYRYPTVINTDFSKGKDQNSSNLYKVMIDPYGFYPPKGFDPWAWKAFPQGALSVNLWKPGQAPNTGTW